MYAPLFAKPNRIIVDLNNIIDTSIGIDGEYLGTSDLLRFIALSKPWTVTLSVTYYSSSLLHPPVKAADLILPLSNFSPDQANYVAVPPALDVSCHRAAKCCV